jgi:NADH:ubiquinone oxidoreductase subunit 3 (subunit A)
MREKRQQCRSPALSARGLAAVEATPADWSHLPPCAIINAVLLARVNRTGQLLEGLLVSANIAYLYAGILLAAGFVFVIVVTIVANLLAPHKHTKEKLQTYESGETPIGSAWVQYPLGFYIFALLFVAFDVDIVFIISWAVIFKQLSIFGFVEMLFFIVVLALGLVYAWRKGVTRWI